MSNRELLRVPCSRCAQTVTVEKSDYLREDGTVYCDECLAPFYCDSCGERKYTIPEKISADTSLTCADCATSKSSGGTQTEDHLSHRALRFASQSAAFIFAFFLVISVIFPLTGFFDVAQTGVQLQHLAYGYVYVVWVAVAYELIRLCWTWEPYMGVLRLVAALGLRLTSLVLFASLILWPTIWAAFMLGLGGTGSSTLLGAVAGAVVALAMWLTYNLGRACYEWPVDQ